MSYNIAESAVEAVQPGAQVTSGEGEGEDGEWLLI